MTFLALRAAARTGVGETTNFLPTVTRLDVRWFQDFNFSTVVLKRAAILLRVSPARTVYQVVRADRDAFCDRLDSSGLVSKLDATRDGATPLIGITNDCPILRTGVFPNRFAWEISVTVVPYVLAIAASVSPLRTTCSRKRIRLFSGSVGMCSLNFSA